MAEYIEYHPLKFWLDPASIAEIVAHIQSYLVANPINSTTEIETIIHDYLIAHPEIIGGVRSINGETGEVVLTADNISGGENVTIKDVLDSLQDQIDDIVASISSDYQQLINDVSDLKSAINDYMVNAKVNFGAKGDGITDDTTALQNCFDYAAEHGVIAFLPSGIYMVSAPLINKGAHIAGASISIQEETPSTAIKASANFAPISGNNNGVLNCLKQQTKYSDFIIENITINANSRQYYALNMRVSAKCNNVYCIGGMAAGSYCKDAYHIIFTNCIFNHNAKYGVLIDQRNNSIEFINCIINDNGTSNADANVMIDNVSYNKVNNNACVYFIGCEIDAAIAGSNVSINGVDTLTFDACYFEKTSDACFTIRGVRVNTLNIINSYFLDVNFNLTFNGTFIGNSFRLINEETGTAKASGSNLLKGGNYFDENYTT